MYDLKSLTVLMIKCHQFLDSSYMFTKYPPV